MISFLRFIFVVCIFFVIRRLFRWLSGGSMRPPGRPQGGAHPPSTFNEKNLGKMVKDPVCGTYVDPSLAVSLFLGERSLYFCSKECRSKYESGRSRTASG